METVGQRLRQVRESKGLTIKDIETETSIRALYIKAIEEDDYAVVPGEVYLKGFIRSYASHLGLDAQSLIEMYRAATASVTDVQENEFKTEDQTFSPVQKGDSFSEVQRQEKTESEKSGFVRWIMIGGVVVAAALVAFFWLKSDSSKPEPLQKPSTAVSQSKPAEKTTAEKSSDKVQSKAPETKNNVSIAAKFIGNCWTMVMVDGKVVFEGIPKTGESMSWVGQKDVVIKAGNAAAVEISKNGQPLGKLGNAGEVVEKIFSVNASN